MGATGTQYHLAWPTRVGTKRYQWTSRRDRPPAAPPGGGRARLEPPRDQECPTIPQDPCDTHVGPGMATIYKAPKR
jgi:hypothetical protein